MKKAFIAVIKFDVDAECDACDPTNVAHLLAIALRRADDEDTPGRPSYRYADVTVYDEGERFLADFAGAQHQPEKMP